MQVNSTTTLVELIEAYAVEIPIIQRDYVQGRKEAMDVRNQFLGSIHQALTSERLQDPLDLDFVYGSVLRLPDSLFSVLDGQQRLTTLFLLHWYIATKEARAPIFRSAFSSQEKSKFTYKVRVSASEFFDALTLADGMMLDSNQETVSESIVDQPWFFLSWKSDPTVTSCLAMLDAIHGAFRDADGGLYARLIDKSAPRIVFQYLELDSFGLSDELYIKMNARGKALSSFENFKAWFVSQLGQLPEGKDLEVKLDKEWTDAFWRISQDTGAEFDDLYLRFFNLMAFYNACEISRGGYDSMGEHAKDWLQRLRTHSGYLPSQDFEEFGSFSATNIRRLQVVLDYLSDNLSDLTVSQAFKEALTTDDYVRQAKFFAFVKFIQVTGVSSQSDEFAKNMFRWNRVTNNLINNYRIDELSNFLLAIRGIAELVNHCDNIYGFLAESGSVSGFSKEQREEESRKARLILADDSWEALLYRYEAHDYFQGKISFLLNISIPEGASSPSQALFINVAVKASVLMSDEILCDDDFLLQRALLTLGDYLVSVGGYRYSFCTHNRGSYRERSENWLKVLNAPVFGELIRTIDGDVKDSLLSMINKSSCNDWRALIIAWPEVIRYCRNRLVHKQDGMVYLLSKSTFKGFHAELRTFVLHQELKKLQATGRLPGGVSSFNYCQVYDNDTPHMVIEHESVQHSIYFDEEGFYCWDDESRGSLPGFLVGLLPETPLRRELLPAALRANREVTSAI